MLGNIYEYIMYLTSEADSKQISVDSRRNTIFQVIPRGKIVASPVAHIPSRAHEGAPGNDHVSFTREDLFQPMFRGYSFCMSVHIVQIVMDSSFLFCGLADGFGLKSATNGRCVRRALVCVRGAPTGRSVHEIGRFVHVYPHSVIWDLCVVVLHLSCPEFVNAAAGEIGVVD